MSTALREALEERLTLRNLVAWAAVFGGLHLLLGAPASQLATTAVLGAAYGLADAARDAYGVRESVTHVLTGSVGVAGGAAMLALGEGPPWLSAGFAPVGAWFVLDAVQTARHEGLTETEPDGREVYRDYLARRVHELLKERARTRRELHAEFDADAADVDTAVAHLRESGLVEARGSELRVPAADDGTLGRVREGLAGFARRLARPVTLEFGTDGREDSRDRSASTPEPGTGEGPGTETEPTSAGSRRTDDREPESEAAGSG